MSKVTFNPKRDIPYLAATIQAIIFGYSGFLLLGWMGWIIGGLMGVLVSVSVLYASSQYAGTARERKPWIVAGLAVMMLFSPIINGTAVYFELPIKIWDILRVVVSVAWGILPDVAGAVAGFVAGKGMVRADEQAQSQVEPKAKKIKASKAAALPLAPVAIAIPCKYKCGFERATQQAINAHYRGCKLNPANMPVRVDLGV